MLPELESSQNQLQHSFTQTSIHSGANDDDTYLGLGHMPDLDALPKDTALESRTFKVQQKEPTEITLECNPLDRLSHSDTPVPLDKDRVTRP